MSFKTNFDASIALIAGGPKDFVVLLRWLAVKPKC